VGPTDLALNFANDPALGRSGFSEHGVGPHQESGKLMDVSLVSKLGNGATVGLSISSGSRSLTRRLADTGPQSFLVNQDVLSTPGFQNRSGKSFAFRQRVGPFALNASHETGDVPRAYAGDLTARYSLSMLGVDKAIGRTSLFMSFSRLSESGTVLGGRLGSVFGTAGATSVFVDGQATRDFARNWSASLSVRRGWTRFASGQFTTSGYSLRLDKTGIWRSDDTVTFLLSQPLRVAGGGLSMLLPQSYDYASATPSYNLARMDLTPSGRELVSEVGYSRRLGFGQAGFNLYARRQPGHYASAGPDVGAVVQFKARL
jgi:hypothetical protein